MSAMSGFRRFGRMRWVAPEWMASALEQSPLSIAEESALLRQWRETGDEAALHRLVMSNAKGLLVIADTFGQRYGLPLEDAFNDAVEGALHAATLFEDRGLRFLTFAGWHAVARLQGVVGDMRGAVRYPSCSEAYKASFSGKRSPDARIQSAVSLDETVGDTGLTRAELMPSTDPSPEDNCVQTDAAYRRQELLDICLASMAPRTASVLRARHLTAPPVTLERLAKRLGVSRERVRQIETAGMKRLERALRARSVDERTVGAWL